MSRRLIVIVCGGRHNVREGSGDLLSCLFRFLRPDEVLHGGAIGIDSLAGQVAENNGFETNVFEPDYSVGSWAPHKRNREMADYARKNGGGYCIAFPGGSGTDSMVKEAHYAGLTLIDLRPYKGLGKVEPQLGLL